MVTITGLLLAIRNSEVGWACQLIQIIHCSITVTDKSNHSYIKINYEK